METRHFLLTGASGNLGFAVLRRLLAHSRHRVTALVRPNGARVVAFALQQIGVDPGGRLAFVAGDIAVPWCGVRSDERRLAAVTDVVHCAADVRWHAPAAALLATNVGGTRHVLDLAAALDRRSRLNRVTVVSSAYVAGVAGGTIPERPLAPTRFNNPYEVSKFLMEREALGRTALPVNVVRPSAIVGDSSDGVVQRFSTLYFPFRLALEDRFRLPGLRLFPGYPDAVLDTVPCDYVARVIEALHEQRFGPGEVVHACLGARADRIDELWALVCRTFNLLAPLPHPRRTGVYVPPAVARSARPLVPILPRAVAKTVERLLLYLPYVSGRRWFETGKIDRLGITPPPALASYLEVICRHAMQHRFRDVAARLPPADTVDLRTRRRPAASGAPERRSVS